MKQNAKKRNTLKLHEMKQTKWIEMNECMNAVQVSVICSYGQLWSFRK